VEGKYGEDGDQYAECMKLPHISDRSERNYQPETHNIVMCYLTISDRIQKKLLALLQRGLDW
jgi:hypothetical protein